jgi:lipopolysaccharide heptosyltransferase I
MRVLVVKPSSLGDVVHALPTVNLIRKKFADAHIAWLINSDLASLLRNCPLINERIEFHRREHARLPALIRYLRSAHFGLVVDLQGLLRSGLMTAATRARRRIGLSDAREGARYFYNEIVPVGRAHAVDRYLQVARHLGCETGPIEFPLGHSERDKAHIDNLLDGRTKLIAVNPSARWKTKLWGNDKFATLVRQLPRNRVVLTGSAAEASATDEIANGSLNLAGKTSLAQLTELYRRCSVVITNDSGPMHVAAAVSTPVVAIFGATDPALTGPYGQQHIVLRSGILCSPCLKSRCAHTPRMECMSLVTVEQVLAAAKPFLV